MSGKPAALPLFADAYLADTMHLSTEEHGAYLLLLMAAWRQEDCGLPNDDRKLARIAGLSLRKWTSIRDTILDFWVAEEGRIYQPRLSLERDYVRQKSTSNRENAGKRWAKQRVENKQTDPCDRICDGNAPPPPPIVEPNGSTPPVSPRAKKPKVVKFAMPVDWKPAELPPDIAELVAQWPPGRFEREVADVRDYWIEDGAKRPGWDRTLHSRIRNIHDRVLRENRNGLPARQANLRPSAGSRGERRNPLLDLVRATETDYPEEDREPDWQGGPTLRAIGQI